MRPKAIAFRRPPGLLALVLVAAALLTGCSYVVLGDSLGTNGATTYATDYAKALHVQPTVLATPGELLPAFEQRLLQDQSFRTAIAHADVVTLSIGSNDLGLDLIKYELGGCNKTCVDTALSGFETDYARTLGELRALTRARITVLDIYDPAPGLAGPYVVGKLASVNAFIHQTACAHGMLPASVSTAFNGPDGTGDPNTQGYLASDGTHPSAAGAQVIADAVLAAHC
ncbi:MAG: SGNH/GDSL hydrolase family protein [Chloroflexota bacterium]|nr:SGNH/GDSL hydrolase family protein [Chloroflexota bacterium]